MRSAILVVSASAAFGQWLGKGTASRHSTDPIYTCPGGYNLIGKNCERPTQAPATVQCTQGTLRGDACVIETPKQTRCPPGTTPQGKQCVLQLQTPAQRTCPLGYTDTGIACEAMDQLPLIEVCEYGSREGPQCATTETAPYQTTQYCPPGFEEAAKGGCWRATVYDCTPLQHGKGAHGLRGLVGKDGMTAPVTNAKVNVIQQTCERKESAAYVTERACPGGYIDTGAGCVLKNYHPTVTRCSNGGPIEACYTVRTAPHQYECAPGTIMQGQYCVSTQQEPLETYCAQGYDVGNTCQQQFMPQVVCPPGLQLSGNICLGVETAPPQVTVTVTCTGKNCHH